MRTIVNFLALLLILFTGDATAKATPDDFLTQDDTVYVSEISAPPVFDGIGNDNCWQNISWQVIDQVWIPWGTSMDPDDFSGRYKVAWSGQHNLLYFLLEITDDVESDAYKADGSTAAIYNFDMFEVFIDEDKSGGEHVYSTPENAFAYHTFTKFPDNGETTTTFICDDMGSDYRSHFPAFILRKEGNVATWEFSLIVYNDTYSEGNEEGARASLAGDKIIGLSVAYNDDDEPEVDPALTQRDNFIGSVAVSEAAYNDHWKNADDFGTLKLVSGDFNSAAYYLQEGNSVFSLYPNPVSGSFTIELGNDYFGEVEIRIFDTGGKEISRTIGLKAEQEYKAVYNAPQNEGLFIVRLIGGQDIFSERISVMRR
jgi:hypothetical protein